MSPESDETLIHVYLAALARARRGLKRSTRRRGARRAGQIGPEAYEAAVLRQVARRRGSDRYPAVWKPIAWSDGPNIWHLEVEA